MASSMPSRSNTSPATTSVRTAPDSMSATAAAIDCGREAGAAVELEALEHDVVRHQPGDLGEVLEPGEQDPPAAAGEVERHRDGLRRGGDVEDDVGAGAAGEVADQRDRVGGVDHDDVGRTDLLRRVEAQAVVGRPGHDHLARLLRQHRFEHREALVPGTLHDDGLALVDADGLDPVHRGRRAARTA